MIKSNTVVNYTSKRETDESVCRSLQRRLHVTENLIGRLGLEKELVGHGGCVNCLEWDSKGSKLASASDDFQVILWDPFLYKKLHTVQTGHHGNIFSVKFKPESNGNIIITGAGDYEVRVHNLVCKETIRACICHAGRVKRLATAPDLPDVFWSAAEDGIIRQFDLRKPHICGRNEKNVLVDLRTHTGEYIEAKCLSVNPLRTELIAVGANDPYIRIYDRRMIKPVKGPSINSSTISATEDNLPPGCVQYFVPGHVLCRKKFSERDLREYSATYVTFGPNGTELLVNLGSEQIYLFDIRTNERSLLLKHTNDNKEVCLPLNGYCNGFHADRNSPKQKQQMPHHINALKLAGNSLYEKAQYSRSIRIYNEAIGKCPSSSVFYANRAAAYMKRDWCGDMYAAFRDCLTALAHDSCNVKAFFRLARCLFELGWYQEAQECLDNFRVRFPTYAKSVACAALEKDISCKVKHSGYPSKCEHDAAEFEYMTEISGKEAEWRESARDYCLRFYGHCNTTTDIKEANFFGSDGQFVVAGSDDGSIFIWDRKTTNNIRILKGDSSIVNCLQPHPTNCLLATSGIEHVVRLWSPLPQDGSLNVLEITERDEVALTNQRRMKADPFDVVLMNMGLPRPNVDDSDGTTGTCRPS
ncbi:hypothetical protein AAG570_010843 [Ranatra chinensis]|uniref:WD and tetratricopeptide repeats protein 1 n=1 Tax=Ranatra chinensis TaxID=642074 RepID=A0ABD0YIW6_9HEMI